jgi:hypothetical protein
MCHFRCGERTVSRQAYAHYVNGRPSNRFHRPACDTPPAAQIELIVDRPRLSKKTIRNHLVPPAVPKAASGASQTAVASAPQP